MRARDLLLERGWSKGYEMCVDGSMCAVGAVAIALGGVPHLVEGAVMIGAAGSSPPPPGPSYSRLAWLSVRGEWRRDSGWSRILQILDHASDDVSKELGDNTFYLGITDLNDSTDLPTVLRVFDRAISNLKETTSV